MYSTDQKDIKIWNLYSYEVISLFKYLIFNAIIFSLQPYINSKNMVNSYLSHSMLMIQEIISEKQKIKSYNYA